MDIEIASPKATYVLKGKDGSDFLHELTMHRTFTARSDALSATTRHAVMLCVCTTHSRRAKAGSIVSRASAVFLQSVASEAPPGLGVAHAVGRLTVESSLVSGTERWCIRFI